MNEPDILSIARQQLCDAIFNFQIPTCDPLDVSPWLAAALLQKAIRRGADELALRAAATLLRGDAPDRLWRRCGGLAFENIGARRIRCRKSSCRSNNGKGHDVPRQGLSRRAH
jgi:hypothetical protein